MTPRYMLAPLARVASLVAAIALAGCAKPASTAKDPVIHVGEGQPATEALRYMPLENDTVFAYDSAADTGEKGMLVLSVSRPRADRADLKVGSRTERLQVENLGIAYVEGGYLLRTPLTAGSTWKGKGGSTARVDDANATVTVPAGTFKGCLRTVEETRTPGASKAVTSVYCPHVGLVSLDVEGASDEGHEHVTFVLRSFGPKVNLGATGESTVTTSSATD